MDLRFNQDDVFYKTHDGINPAPGDDDPVEIPDVEDELIGDGDDEEDDETYNNDDEDEEGNDEDLDIEKLIEDDIKTDD